MPNASAYSESCAAIANVFWQHRMNLLKGQSKYADAMELALYNSVLAGISISGDRFFYQNPLASENGGNRSKWIGLSCCPTNLARIIPEVGGLVYARSARKIFVNLYAAGTADFRMEDGTGLKLSQQTDYPWNGLVRLTVMPERTTDFTLCLRIPGWTLGRPVPSDLYVTAGSQPPPVTLKVNGNPCDPTPSADGYVHLQRRWTAGDEVTMELPMPVQKIHAHENIVEKKGKIALMRGPVLYCLDAADHPNVDLSRLSLVEKSDFQSEYRPGLLNGMTVLQGMGLADGKNAVTVTAIPYYAWANRSKGAMKVWSDEAAPAGRQSPAIHMT